MKKILFASTALVATAGIASAEVTGSGAGTINITGNAEIGVFGGSAFNAVTGDTDTVETAFHTDVDVVFAMSGEADNGLTFGATVDLDEGFGTAGNNDRDDGGATFFVAYGNARLDMGDTDGAFDAVIKETALAGGSIRDDETGHLGWAHPAINLNNGLDSQIGDGQIARFSYTFSGFTAHLSAEQVAEGNNVENAAGDELLGETIWGLGVRYNADISNGTVGVGIGYQTVDGDNGADLWGISLDGTLSNGLTAAISYSQLDFKGNDNEVKYTSIGFGYEMNNIAVGINYGQYDTNFGADTSGFGLAASYDLGGGLSAQLGYGQGESENDFAGSPDSFSLGLRMNF
ncbi:porin [Cognatishimia sp. F0-27]|uniref:porin n=1 Tax=Cognatishimia sp. F0-27 TaxID=2816855 RepID=UPI001D0C7624|nr:porin [Cognatishimia sp. F0-27]MCC1491427.1 porin [Cognatishimia sp. F0-27]